MWPTAWAHLRAYDDDLPTLFASVKEYCCWKLNEDPTVEGPEAAILDGVVGEDIALQEHGDDASLCDDDCVSDEEHMLEVVPEPVA